MGRLGAGLAKCLGWGLLVLLVLPIFYGVWLGFLFENDKSMLSRVMTWAAPLEAWATVHIPAIENVRADLMRLGAAEVTNERLRLLARGLPADLYGTKVDENVPLAVHVYSLLVGQFIVCLAFAGCDCCVTLPSRRIFFQI